MMMKRYAATAVLSVAALAATAQAHAHDNAGPYIAGALAGLVVGAAIATAPSVYAAPPPVVYYPAQPPVYYVPPPVVYYPPPPPAAVYYGPGHPPRHGWYKHDRRWEF